MENDNSKEQKDNHSNEQECSSYATHSHKEVASDEKKVNEAVVEEVQQEDTATKETVAENEANTTDNKKDDDASKNKGIAIVAYLIFFLPLLMAKDSKFAMYHANQGLVLFLAALGLNIVLSAMMYSPIAMLLSPIIGLTTIAFAIIGMVNASNGEMKELPLIGGIKILK